MALFVLLDFHNLEKEAGMLQSKVKCATAWEGLYLLIKFVRKGTTKFVLIVWLVNPYGSISIENLFILQTNSP